VLGRKQSRALVSAKRILLGLWKYNKHKRKHYFSGGNGKAPLNTMFWPNWSSFRCNKVQNIWYLRTQRYCMQKSSVHKLGSPTFTKQPAETVFDGRQGNLLTHRAFINLCVIPNRSLFFNQIRSSKSASTSAFQINYTVTISGFTSSHWRVSHQITLCLDISLNVWIFCPHSPCTEWACGTWANVQSILASVWRNLLRILKLKVLGHWMLTMPCTDIVICNRWAKFPVSG